MISKRQQTEILKKLRDYGFSEREAEIYLAVLEEGQTSIPSIARASGLPRGTVYDLVESLKDRGYLTEVKVGAKRKIITENPTSKFYSDLERKHTALEKDKQTVDSLLPLVKGLYTSDDFKPQVRVYEGENGFKKVWDEIFRETEKEYLGIAQTEAFVEFAGRDFLEWLIKKKVSLGIYSRAINEHSKLAYELQSRDTKENRETRIVSKDFNFPTTEIVYGDKIAMFATGENIILVIESREFAATHRVYFELLWKSLESK